MNRLDKPNWQQKKEKIRKIKMGALIAVLVLPAIAAGAYFSRGMISNAFGSPVQSRTIMVRAGGDFQAALNNANPGDTIMLQAGATYTGSFRLPNKNGESFITIRSSVGDDKLPKAGERIDPALHAEVLPKLISPTTDPVINAIEGAHHFRFMGVEFGGTKGGFYNIVQIGTAEETKVSQLPHHIEFDRVYMHATSPDGQRRGIAANGRHIVIKNSHISGIRRKGEESQAIAAWGSDGPIEIVNNYLEGAAENILFGGAGSTLKLVPTNCVVKGNTLNKPIEWRKEGWLVKNLFEIKNGRNITVSNNVMTNNWGGGQDGTAVLFTVREDNGPASLIEDIVFENNIIRGSGGAVSVFGSEGSGGRRLTIRNNLFADIDKSKWSGSGQFFKVSDWDGLTVENNTVIHNGNITTAYGNPVRGFVFRNNIVFNNEYGIMGDDASPGRETLSKFFPGAVVSQNIIVGGSEKLYGSDNFYVSSVKQIGFANESRYNLQESSPYLKRGHGGKSVGFMEF